MSSDPPKPDDREAFMNWMLDRDFVLETSTGGFVFRATKIVAEQKSVGDVLGNVPIDLSSVSSKSIALECEEYDLDRETIDGEHFSVDVEYVDEDTSFKGTHKMPFDTVRMEWMQDNLEEL